MEQMGGNSQKECPVTTFSCHAAEEVDDKVTEDGQIPGSQAIPERDTPDLPQAPLGNVSNGSDHRR